MEESINLLNIYKNDIKNIPVLSHEETIELLKRAQNNDKEARDKLVLHNVRLVFKFASKYSKNESTLLDLVQEGSLGLFEAIDKFNLNYDVKFSTYASWWIVNYIYKYLNKQKRIISFPIHIVEDSEKLKNEYERLKNSLGRKPSIDEIKEIMNFSYEKTFCVFNFIKTVRSLDEKLNLDGDLELKDIIPAPEDFFDSIVNDFIRDDLNDAIKKAKLNEREIYILEHRTGINNKERLTLEQLGKKYNVSREAIRQMELKIRKKLKDKIMPLNGYFDDNETIVDIERKENNNYITQKSFISRLNCSYEELKSAVKELSARELKIFHKALSSPLTDKEKGIIDLYLLPKIKEIIIKNRMEISNDNSLIIKKKRK